MQRNVWEEIDRAVGIEKIIVRQTADYNCRVQGKRSSQIVVKYFNRFVMRKVYFRDRESVKVFYS